MSTPRSSNLLGKDHGHLRNFIVSLLSLFQNLVIGQEINFVSTVLPSVVQTEHVEL